MKTVKSLTEFNKAYMKKIQLEETHELPPTLSEPSTVFFLNIHEEHQLQSMIKKKEDGEVVKTSLPASSVW